jgi:hypothetical protein
MKRFLVVVLCIFCNRAFCAKDTCYAGVYLKSIHDLQPIDFSFGADFYLWVSSAKDTIALEKIDFINSKQLERLHPSYSTDSMFDISYENCKGKFHHSWDLQNYPFDKQVLKIKIEYDDDTSKIILLPDKNSFNVDELSIHGWEIVDKVVIDSIHSYRSDFGFHKTYKGNSSYSSIAFVVSIRRESFGLFFKLFSGLYIAFFVAFVSLFVNSKNHMDARFGLSIGGLFAAVANNYVVDSNIPPTHKYSFVDWTHLVTFVFILITLIISAYSLYHSENGRHEHSSQFNKRWRLSFLLAYVGLNLFLISKAIYFS